MKKDNLLIFITLLVALLVSFFTIRTSFDIKALGLLFFLLIVITTLINANIGLVIIIASMLFSPEIIVGQTTSREITIRIEDLILLIIILAWFIRTALTKNIADVFKTPLTKPFFLYILICVISSLFAAFFSVIDLRHSFFCIIKYLEYFLLFLMVRDNLKSLGQSKMLVAVFLATALMVGLHVNTFIGKEIEKGTTFFRASPPVERKGGGESGTLGGYAIFMLAISGGILLTTPSVPLRVFLGGLIILLGRAFLYSLSRGSYLALLPMMFGFLFFSRRLVLIYAMSIIFVMMIIFMPNMIRSRIMTTVVAKKTTEGVHLKWEESPQARIESWKGVLFEKLPKSPIWGHGAGKFFIDSQFFSTLTEVGLLGLFLFARVLSKLFQMAKAVFNTQRIKSNDFGFGLTVGFLAGFIGLLFHALSTNTFIIIRIMEPFWFIAAIVLSLPPLFL